MIRVTRQHERRGTAYLLTISVGSLAAAVALTSIVLRGEQLDDALAAADAAHARTLAQAGLEVAASRIVRDSNWRNTIHGDTLIPAFNLGRGSFTVTVEDPMDGDPRNGDGDPIILTSTAHAGDATFAVQAPIVFRYIPHEALSHSAYTENQLRLASNTSLITNKPLKANDYRVASGSAIDGPTPDGGNYSDATSGGGGGGGLIGIIGGIIDGLQNLLNALLGSQSSPAWLPTNIISTYRAMGPRFTPSDFGQGRFEIRQTILAPGYGWLAAYPNETVIVLDARGQNVTIENARIVGTLVILDAPRVDLINAVLIEPITPNWPALLVQGEVRITMDGRPLDEAVIGFNFNPPDAPFEGASNNNQTDVFQSRIGGLVYATREIDLQSDVRIEGPVLSHRRIRLTGGTTRISVHDELAEFPPPAFRTGIEASLDRLGVARVRHD